MNIAGKSRNHQVFYSQARFYDIAFRFKDLEAENTTLAQLFESLNGRSAQSFLDIAAGPAGNAIAMHLTLGMNVSALDYSEAMVAYGRARAEGQEVPLTYYRGDMRDFSLSSPVDIAAMFMASTGYLLTNDDMVAHLRAVARNLAPQGIYVMEMTHPRDIFKAGSSTSQEWEESHEGCTVKVSWGSPDDPFDPIEQAHLVTVRLKYTTPTESGELMDRCSQREFSYQEMRTLVELSGAFDWVTTLGSWDITVPFSNEKAAWRMIPVLRKRG